MSGFAGLTSIRLLLSIRRFDQDSRPLRQDPSLIMFDTKRNSLHTMDPEIQDIIRRENVRQEHHVELIASENYVSPAVLAAVGSQLTNKYAEGYPGKRYYGGCEIVDEAEVLAIRLVKQLFGAESANVQPHSGSQANAAVFFAVLKPGDTILGMSLSEGGHLTHGMPLNFSGKWFDVGRPAEADRHERDSPRQLRHHDTRIRHCGSSRDRRSRCRCRASSAQYGRTGQGQGASAGAVRQLSGLSARPTRQRAAFTRFRSG